MTGPERSEIYEELKKQTVSEYQVLKFSQISSEAEIGGNISGPQRKETLRKLKSELNKLNLSTDITQETKILMDVYKSITPGGYIHNYSYNPYKVHLMSTQQLIVFKNSAEKVFYFDATSSLIKKIPGQKAFYLYSLVMRHPLQGRVAFPVAEMLSVSQYSSEIKHFLLKLLDFGNTVDAPIKPKRIVTDLSWAILQGCSSAFNDMDMRSYIKFCFETVQRKRVYAEVKKFVIIHCCAAHMTHTFSRRIKSITEEKHIKQYVLFCLCHIMNMTYLPDILTFFRHMCTVIDCQYEDCAVLESKKVIKKSTCHPVDDKNESIADNELLELPTDLPKTIRKSSFYFMFLRELESIPKPSVGIKNSMFCNGLMQCITNDYMGLLPLWSGLMLGDLSKYDSTEIYSFEPTVITRDSNSLIENYFGNLKSGLRPRQRYRVTNFISAHHTLITGQLKEIATYAPKLSAHQKIHTVKPEVEKWSRVTKKSRSYHQPPKNQVMPAPKTAKLDCPRWGGKIKMNGIEVSMTNTCPLDGILFICVQVFSNLTQDELKDHSPMLTVVTDTINEIRSKSWDAGKLKWILSTGQRSINGDNNVILDLYGTEFGLFGQYFGQLFRGERKSSCSGDLCPEKEKIISSTEIILRYVLILYN